MTKEQAYAIQVRQELLNQKIDKVVKQIKKPTYFTSMTAETLLDDPETREVTDIMIEKDGSVRAFLTKSPEPVRQWPDHRTVMLTAEYKRLVPLLVGNLAKMGWIKRIITLLAVKFNFNLFPEWLGYIMSLNSCLLKPEHYSQPVKEIRRVLRWKIDDNLVDAIGLILEYDMAYRYRLQDIIVLLDKGNDPVKEIIRLIDILITRDIGNDGMIVKYRNLQKFLPFLIFGKTKRLLARIFRDIDLEEMKLSKEDIYWTNEFGLYNYRGLSVEERKNENAKNYS